MTRQEFELHKAKAVSLCLQKTLEAVTKNAFSGLTIENMQINFQLILAAGKAELVKIMSQPFPEYPRGGPSGKHPDILQQ